MISRYPYIRTLPEKARDRLQAAFNKIERDVLLWLLERLEVRIVGAPDKSCHKAADCIIALRDFMKEMSDGTRPSRNGTRFPAGHA